MKTTAFHGTTADNLPSILSHGLLANSGEEKIWNCSHDAVYCWHPGALVESGDTEKELSEETAFRFAFESAQFGLGKAKDCRAVIIEFEIEENQLEIDDSCDHMTHARCFRGNIPLNSIKKISISNDFSLLKGYFLSFALDRDLCNLEFSDLERKIAEKMKDAEIYPEDIEDLIEWEIKEFN